MVILSTYCSSSANMCEEIKIVFPSLFNFFKVSNKFLRAIGSRFAAGSSKIKISGSLINA
ncbi:hypothetical protein oki361_20260 [Helicobacter pylori]